MKILNISFILMTAAMVVTAIILFRILRRILEPKTTSNLIKEYSSDYIPEKKKKYPEVIAYIVISVIVCGINYLIFLKF